MEKNKLLEIETPYLVLPVSGKLKDENKTHLFIEDEEGVIYEIKKDQVIKKEIN